MSAVARRIGGVEIVRLSGNRATIAGRLGEVDHLLERIRRAGQLVSASDPVPDGRPGVYAVTVRLTPPERPRTPPAPPRPVRRTGVIALAVVAAVVAIVGIAAWMVVAVVQAVTGLLAVAIPAVLGGIVVLAAIAACASVRGGGFSGTFKGRMD